MDSNKLHARARTKGVNPIVYWLMRAWLQPFAHLYWRLSRIGREHIPTDGPVIFVCNHRSFIDPFIVGLCSRRPIYYVAKEEIFHIPFVGWLISALGAFPVRRGAADADMIETAKAILERGDAVLMFPEGTRTRPGALGKPKRGVGRLALETGATVVPVAMIGTEAIRKGWRIRPHKIRVRIGAPLRFPKVETATTPLAAAVTDRIWPNVMLQWEWLGGLPPLRRAAVIGTGPWSTSLSAALTRAGIDVDLGTPNSSFTATTLSCSTCPPRNCPQRSPSTGPGSSTGPACSFAPPDSCRRSAHCPAATSANSSTHGRSARSAGPRDVLEDDAAIVVASQQRRVLAPGPDGAARGQAEGHPHL